MSGSVGVCVRPERPTLGVLLTESCLRRVQFLSLVHTLTLTLALDLYPRT